jgi:predicted nucleic acid-binding protein
VSRVVVLDATRFGMLCHPRPRWDAFDCQIWAANIVAAGGRLIIAEVTDYEVRRELIRARRAGALRALNDLLTKHVYVPLDTSMMRHAAELWAHVRQLGLPTAGPESLDADAVLAAQALSLNDPSMIVATANPTHLSRFVPADHWRNITP